MDESWTNAFVGIPWKEMGRDRDGVDCWGLFRLVYAEMFGIDVPSYTDSYHSPESNVEVGALIIDETAKDWIQVGNPCEGDGILFDVKGEPSHTAIFIRTGSMLHVRRGTGSCVECYDGPIWTPRFLGFYRHPSRQHD